MLAKQAECTTTRCVLCRPVMLTALNGPGHTWGIQSKTAWHRCADEPATVPAWQVTRNVATRMAALHAVFAAAAAMPRWGARRVHTEVWVRRKLGDALLQGRQPAARHAEHPQLRRRPQRPRHIAALHNTNVSAQKPFWCYVFQMASCEVALTSVDAMWWRHVIEGQVAET